MAAVDILGSLLNVLDFPDILMEERFFTSNPRLGKYVNWPTLGSIVSPDDLPQSLKQVLVIIF